MEHPQSLLERFAQRFAIPIVGILAIAIIGGAVLAKKNTLANDLGFVAPSSGTSIPVAWGDLGKRLVDTGVIDEKQLLALHGTLSSEQESFLTATSSSEIIVTPENAPYLLNLFWAFGLANKDPILAEEMMDPRYGGAGGFASTGGWTIAKGNPMNHYNKHAFITLTAAQQKLVDDVSENIYRPCCNNPTHFPDCNHGMAMLGLLELMASQGKSEDDMYRAALTMNSYWFPSQYQTLAAYFASRGENWKNASPKEILGKEYSSASGYARIAAIMQPKQSGGGSCNV